jgi:hypothetical protein
MNDLKFSFQSFIRLLMNLQKSFNKDESVKGAIFHPTEEDIMVTYGKKHLSLWQRQSDGTIDNRTAIKNVFNLTLNYLNI